MHSGELPFRYYLDAQSRADVDAPLVQEISVAISLAQVDHSHKGLVI